MPDTCANPLLLQWIKEWLDQARERNSKGCTVYKKAYDSMKACPLKFNHPAEAQQLHGLGPKLCDRLTDKLKAHCAENGLPMPEMPYQGSKRQSDDEGEESTRPAKKPKKAPKQYVPAFRSGPYALLLALLTLDENASIGLSKDELIEIAQPHCDSNFKTPSEPGKFFTAWNSMKTLTSKDLVHEHGRPVKRYMLTDEGREIALKIHQVEVASGRITDHFNEPSKSLALAGKATSTTAADSTARSWDDDDAIETIFSSQEEQATTSRPQPTSTTTLEPISSTGTLNFTPIHIPPGTFTVHLLLDNREIRSTTDRDYISTELLKGGIHVETRALPVGDALWIARINPTSLPSSLSTNSEDEVVLDHIVERKRLDDLIGSIKDGRFHEQKFRLRKSGIRNVTYIVEDFSISDQKSDKFGDAVASAIASTQVVNGFFVKRTKKLDDTIRYLARMTQLLQTQYSQRPLHIIPSKVLHPQTYNLALLDALRAKTNLDHYITFPAFASLTTKSADLTLRDVYLKMLMCTRGVTGEKAMEIQKIWKTPREFVEGYERLEEEERALGVKTGGGGGGGGVKRERMVSDRLGDKPVARKKVGRQLSRKICDVWGETG